jgi:uncharacterized protein
MGIGSDSAAAQQAACKKSRDWCSQPQSRRLGVAGAERKEGPKHLVWGKSAKQPDRLFFFNASVLCQPRFEVALNRPVLYSQGNRRHFMEEFISYLVKNIVNQPDAVDIRSLLGQNGLLIEIRVAPEYIGKVVGRKGNVIRSLRTLAMTIGARLGRRIHLEIIQQ